MQTPTAPETKPGTLPEAPPLRLWTFQQESMLPRLLSGPRYVPSWSFVPANWRPAYEWMALRLQAHTGLVSVAPPVWCWYACAGRPGERPRVGTAAGLLSAAQIAQGMVTLELLVPRQAVLLSSYRIWNEFLDEVIRRDTLPAGERWLRMFQVAAVSDPQDDVQAVLPYIERSWLAGSSKLVIGNRDWQEPI